MPAHESLITYWHWSAKPISETDESYGKFPHAHAFENLTAIVSVSPALDTHNGKIIYWKRWPVCNDRQWSRRWS